MENFIIVAILVCIVGGIGYYLYRAKKRGETCIGCPYAKQCGGKCGGNCGHDAGHGEKDK
ncbi:MAG: FeoB-associated Cys-rich membrane protein [Clostridia bacterium]|nr:FeoB-associated Cys-rich membrane protein [Clostridia bacterium]